MPKNSLNPYSNGLPSLTRSTGRYATLSFSLNPYSNGLPSLTLTVEAFKSAVGASLNPYSNGLPSLTFITRNRLKATHTSLNPYSNGLPSLTIAAPPIMQSPRFKVLIPILMDYPL